MAIYPGPGDEPETALKRFERKVHNGQVRANYRATKIELSDLDLKGEPVVSGEARIDVPRIKTAAEKRAGAILNSIRKTIARERKNAEYVYNLQLRARLIAELDKRRNPQKYKRRLLLEKLRRVESGRWP